MEAHSAKFCAEILGQYSRGHFQSWVFVLTKVKEDSTIEMIKTVSLQSSDNLIKERGYFSLKGIGTRSQKYKIAWKLNRLRAPETDFHLLMFFLRIFLGSQLVYIAMDPFLSQPQAPSFDDFHSPLILALSMFVPWSDYSFTLLPHMKRLIQRGPSASQRT